MLQACLTDIDRIERGASKVADGPLRPHKALCKVLKRQAGNLEDALDGSGNTARIRELRDSLAAARSLVEGFSSASLVALGDCSWMSSGPIWRACCRLRPQIPLLTRVDLRARPQPVLQVAEVPAARALP